MRSSQGRHAGLNDWYIAEIQTLYVHNSRCENLATETFNFLSHLHHHYHDQRHEHTTKYNYLGIRKTA